MDYLLFQLFHVSHIDLFTDKLIQPRCHRVFPRHGLYRMEIRHIVYFSDDLLILRSRYLRAVLPVNLIAVVLRRIMARRHNNAGNTA